MNSAVLSGGLNLLLHQGNLRQGFQGASMAVISKIAETYLKYIINKLHERKYGLKNGIHRLFHSFTALLLAPLMVNETRLPKVEKESTISLSSFSLFVSFYIQGSHSNWNYIQILRTPLVFIMQRA